ncbi:MAG: NACHT domain-containing NTPase [Okeania sp. SIO3B3]|nr:NACHT domain-containing NTPase [Okeania sp. SIO3B3]
MKFVKKTGNCCMTVEDGISLSEKLINRNLTELELLIFRESWQGRNGKKYREIAGIYHCKEGTVNDEASRLWKSLSEALGNEKVLKSNFKRVLEDYWRSLSENTPKNEGQVVEKISPTKPNFSEINNSENDIDALVQRVKEARYERIKFQCGKLHTLHTREIEITKIYTDVNILENPTNERWLEIPDLVNFFKSEEEVNSGKFDRLGLSKTLERKSGLEVVGKYQNLMILGKPGSGKTTFLKWLAIKCNDNEDNFLADRLPMFITLEQLSDDKNLDNENFDFLDYIFTEEFSEICEKKELEKILSCGKAFILLDGLDEVVPAEKAKQLAKSIQKFANSNSYYQNKFIISCRIAAQEYKFQGFTYIEVADFNERQVKKFVENWFVAVDSNSPENGRANAKQFLEKIRLPENKQIRELAVTPILLNLACVVFQDRLEFPSKRSKLYEEGLNILLSKWDEKRGIQRDEVYKNLSVLHKKELLTQVAATTFETGDYFFESEKVQKLIVEYLQSLPDSNQDKIQLQLDSEVVLNSLEAQHGLLIERANKIYSFSHLTFHEYFTAKFFIENSDWEKLIQDFPQRRWIQVFFLAIESLENADDLLLTLKQKIDNMAAKDKLFQDNLKWISGKESLVDHRNRYKLAAIRAIYLSNLPMYTNSLPANTDLLLTHGCGRTTNTSLGSNIDSRFSIIYKNRQKSPSKGNMVFFENNILCSYVLYVSKKLDDYHRKNYDDNIIFNNVCASLFAELEYDFIINKKLEDFTPTLKKSLPELAKILDIEKDSDSKNKDILEWWYSIVEPQIEDLLIRIIEHNFKRPHFEFTLEQFKLHEDYFSFNYLLINCLNNSNVSPEVREEIEETLLLPLEEIEKWKQQHRPNNS